jgi:hypothetical protein
MSAANASGVDCPTSGEPVDEIIEVNVVTSSG